MNVKKIVRITIKIFFGIDGISLFAKKLKKNICRRLFTKKYTAQDLVDRMCDMGMKNGSVIFIHSSMTEFYNYTGTAIDLINKIIETIGDSGTLLMPAYPKNKNHLYKIASETNEIVFDVNSTPSGAGYLTEVFRTFPNVKRSINLQHSVCALGKLAEFFVSEHHLSEVAWDSYSPYYKLAKINGLIFSLGLKPYLRNVTLIHCTESFLRDKYTYFASFFGKKIIYKYKDANNNIFSHSLTIPLIGGVRSKSKIKRFFDRSKFKRSKLSNLNIELIESCYMFNRCIELAENGISIYSKPSSRNYINDGHFIKINETS